MTLLFIIDHFGSGGAQRQMVNLAIGLKQSGHDVNFFIYYPEYNFYRPELEKNSIKIIDYFKKRQGFSLGVCNALRKLLKSNKYNIALAYLDSPGIYLLLAGIGSKTKLIVSERSSYLAALNRNCFLLKRQLFRLADKIVANSGTQKRWLVQSAGFSDEMVVTIYNGYNQAEFQYSKLEGFDGNCLNLIAIGGVRPVKNIENLILALDLFHKKHKWLPSISWVGKSDSLKYERKIISMLQTRNEVKAVWRWLGERNDVPVLLADHHALISPSYYEGLPNVVCEALFAGKPVLASNICDNPVLIKDGVRGYLFDPKSPDSIVKAIERLLQLSNEEQREMSLRNRMYAEENLTLDEMVGKYISLFNSVLN